MKTTPQTKCCSKCERDLPIEENFYKDKKSPDGRQSQCNECKRIRRDRGKNKKERLIVATKAASAKKAPKTKDSAGVGYSVIKYSKRELEEFRSIITNKINASEEVVKSLLSSVSGSESNGTDDTASSVKGIEDGSDILAKEETMAMASRQQKFVSKLMEALVRIDQGTYGICVVSGRLIPKERLMAVPHATTCIESKYEKEKGSFVAPTDTGNEAQFEQEQME
jgi:DnaK suppressor protein